MKLPQPRPRWFLVLLPIFLMSKFIFINISSLILTGEVFLDYASGDFVLFILPYFSFYIFYFWGDLAPVLGGLTVVISYLLIIGILILGYIRPTKTLFILFCGVILIDLVACVLYFNTLAEIWFGDWPL